MRNYLSEKWILDKRINLGNVFTAGIIAISIFWWAAQIEKRIAVLEVQLKTHYDGVHRLSAHIDKLMEHH